MKNHTSNLIKIVKQIKDERQSRGKRYSTEIIIWILILSVLLGGENLVSICEFFLHKKKLKKVIFQITGEKIVNIPHPTTISRALEKIKLTGLLKALNLDQLGKENEDALQIAGDGKVMRGIHDGSKRQILSFVSQDLLPLYQVELETKENEITALVKLLKENKLKLPKETLFTLDAIHTQVKTIKLFQERGFNYLLKVKDNQKELKDQLEYIFDQGMSDKSNPLIIDTHRKFEKNHDRLTTWEVTNSREFDSQDLPKGFESVKTIGFIRTRTRRPVYERGAGKKSYINSTQRVFFISSLTKKAKELFEVTRNHWRVEKLHWIKDVLYQEDKQTLKGKPAYFLTFIKSLSINLITQLSSQVSKTVRRLNLDHSFLIQSLTQLGIM